MAKKRKTLWIILGSIFGLILILIIIGIFAPELEKYERELEAKKAKEASPPPSPETVFIKNMEKIFGKPKKIENSGVVSIQYGKTDSAMRYNFYPLGPFKHEDELGIHLAPKIKKLYETSEEFDSIVFVVHGPLQDSYGNIAWKPILSFEFDRSVYNRIVWEKFINQDLLKVAKNVEWFRRGAGK